MKILCAKLDANIRYRLRMCIWKHWKTPQNRAKNLMKLGIDRITAYKVGYCSRAYAHVCSCGAVNIAITNKRLASFGLIMVAIVITVIIAVTLPTLMLDHILILDIVLREMLPIQHRLLKKYQVYQHRLLK